MNAAYRVNVRPVRSRVTFFYRFQVEYNINSILELKVFITLSCALHFIDIDSVPSISLHFFNDRVQRIHKRRSYKLSVKLYQRSFQQRPRAKGVSSLDIRDPRVPVR